MLSKLLPIVFLAFGVGSGIGAGLFLVPAPQSYADAESSHAEGAQQGHAADSEPGHKPDHGASSGGQAGEAAQSNAEFVKMNNQFVVPVVKDDKIVAMVVVSLSLEVNDGLREEIYAREPKLRDSFLQVLFDHSNMGGFDGAFTRPESLDLLRNALRDVARKEFGDDVLNVLIVDIARQDM